jgi:septum site-determining protein MinC
MQKARKPIEIKISTVVAISAILHETDPTSLEKALKEMTGGVADFFEDEFAVLDIGTLDAAAAAAIDWSAVVALFKRFRLNTVAVRNAPEELHGGIVAQGLAIDNSAVAGRHRQCGRKRRQPSKPHQHQPRQPAPVAPPAAAAPAPQPAPAPVANTVVIDTPVRAGQRIYARGADLVVLAVVNNGAELIADGCIHVYAPLRGRALAGASGNTRRASSLLHWKRNWFPLPASIGPSRTVMLRSSSASRCRCACKANASTCCPCRRRKAPA